MLVIHNPDSLHESSDLQDSVAFHDTVMTVISVRSDIMQPPAAGIQDQQARTWQRGPEASRPLPGLASAGSVCFCPGKRLVQSDNAGVTLHFIKVSSLG